MVWSCCLRDEGGDGCNISKHKAKQKPRTRDSVLEKQKPTISMPSATACDFCMRTISIDSETFGTKLGPETPVCKQCRIQMQSFEKTCDCCGVGYIKREGQSRDDNRCGRCVDIIIID